MGQHSGEFGHDRIDFSKVSHEQLVHMVDRADPVAVMEVGQRLLSAAMKMHEISDELHAHMSGLEWEGVAADSFRSWGGQVSGATMQLGDYVRNAGRYMATAGETLAEVRSGMPDVPTADVELVAKYHKQPRIPAAGSGSVFGGFGAPAFGPVAGGAFSGDAGRLLHPDWVTREQAQAAQLRIDQAHVEAMSQMTKLGQSYDQSVTQLTRAEPPVFPPPPGAGPGTVDTSAGVSIGSTTVVPAMRTGIDSVAPLTASHHRSAGAAMGVSGAIGSSGIDGAGGGLPGGGLAGAGAAGGGPGSVGFGGTVSGAGGVGTPTGAAGTVAGAAGPAGRPGASMMPQAGGMGGAVAGGAGARKGGGLTSLAGGVVGGGDGPAAGGAFTEGGTGLRGRAERGAAGGRFGAHGAAVRTGRENRADSWADSRAGSGADSRAGSGAGSRADSRAGDEETWTSGTGAANPGVIE